MGGLSECMVRLFNFTVAEAGEGGENQLFAADCSTPHSLEAKALERTAARAGASSESVCAGNG